MRVFSPEYTPVIGIMWHKTDQDHLASGLSFVASDSVNYGGSAGIDPRKAKENRFLGIRRRGKQDYIG
jgi:hypothetical protein